ncbi:hypothetical protein Ppa06_18170 [Planomonospora parontospora subsp. parontospora]|uniref:Uncharacterized protein n=2 Tax=Planomonospora parontospora TaxID=58119 RepID=A0AA37F4C7_9ACTN|nr:hypothetical protein [Planomonospora parontospora]GGK65046.1 hypothetical protein GCM10010126_25420 [Planomonospora parontospora]GII08019.1 hypothetical protein Ppa06_18170 [Planomonospora parontospora subsp. parontospora]
MQTVIGILFVGVVLFGVDRLMLFLESRGHVNWRRKGRLDLSAGPVAELESLLVPDRGDGDGGEHDDRWESAERHGSADRREYAGRS